MGLRALPSGGGTLALQPASHLGASDDCDDASEAPREVPIEPGSVVVYDARTCHLGTANHAVQAFISAAPNGPLFLLRIMYVNKDSNT